MTSVVQLRRQLEDCEIQHDFYAATLSTLRRRIADALQGFEYTIEWTIGPSRVGKSALITALKREYPETKINGKRHVPVLIVKPPQGASSLLLPSSVFTAFGLPLPLRGITSGVMFHRMVDQLKLAQTKVIIFEEASQLVDVGARIPARGVGDWFKSLADSIDITILMFGVPRLQKLFDSNEQLRLRASAKIEFRPYDFQVQAEANVFASCVQTYVELFKRGGWPIQVDFHELVFNCYLLSGGLIGQLCKFLKELASQLDETAPRQITWNDCRRAAMRIQSAGHPDHPAFVKPLPAPIELAVAYAHVLQTNAMSVHRSQRED